MIINTDLNHHINIIFSWHMNHEAEIATEDYVEFSHIELRNNSGEAYKLAISKANNTTPYNLKGKTYLLDYRRIKETLEKDNYKSQTSQLYLNIIRLMKCGGREYNEVELISQLLQRCVEPEGQEIFEPIEESIIKFKDFL